MPPFFSLIREELCPAEAPCPLALIAGKFLNCHRWRPGRGCSVLFYRIEDSLRGRFEEVAPAFLNVTHGGALGRSQDREVKADPLMIRPGPRRLHPGRRPLGSVEVRPFCRWAGSGLNAPLQVGWSW